MIKRHVFTSHKPEFPDWYCTSLYWFAVLIQCFKTIRHHYTLVWKFSMCCTCINKITLRLHNLHCTYVWNGFEIKVFSNVLDFVICDEPRLHCGHDQWLYVWPGLIVFYLLFCSFSCAYYISTCVFFYFKLALAWSIHIHTIYCNIYIFVINRDVKCMKLGAET